MTAEVRRALLAVGTLVAVYCAQQLDVVLVGKFAPVIADSLQVPLPAMAVVFIASQAGLAAGALLGGVAGDRWGRRRVVAACVAAAAVFTVVAPWVGSVVLFAVLRGCIGLLLGAAAPCLLAMVAGVASARWRSVAVTMTLAGASLGSALGSALAFAFGTARGWPYGFWICGAGLATSLLLFSTLVPEPKAAAGERVDGLPAAGLLGRWRRVTLVLGVAFLLSMGTNALLFSWMPSFFNALAGISVQQFAGIAMYTTPVAAAGMICTGWLSRRLSLSTMALLCFGGYAIALASLGTLRFASVGFILALALSSFGQAACQALLNLTVVARYPEALRASALGAAAAAGRTGGILLPGLGALALHVRLPLQPLFLLIAAVPVAIGALVWQLDRRLAPTRAA